MKRLKTTDYSIGGLATGFIYGFSWLSIFAGGILLYQMVGQPPEYVNETAPPTLGFLGAGMLGMAFANVVDAVVEIALNTRILASKAQEESNDE